jgi:hypothetical protein
LKASGTPLLPLKAQGCAVCAKSFSKLNMLQESALIFGDRIREYGGISEDGEA